MKAPIFLKIKTEERNYFVNVHQISCIMPFVKRKNEFKDDETLVSAQKIFFNGERNPLILEGDYCLNLGDLDKFNVIDIRTGKYGWD